MDFLVTKLFQELGTNLKKWIKTPEKRNKTKKKRYKTEEKMHKSHKAPGSGGTDAPFAPPLVTAPGAHRILSYHLV